MTIERSHGKARPTLPRASALTVPQPARSRTEGRDAMGRFASGNPWAPGARWRELVSEGLGRGRQLDGDGAVVARRSYRYFRAFLRDLPIDCATTRSLVAQRARAAALADHYGIRAAELGLSSDEAIAAAEQSAKWCQRAERLAVTSLDIAAKLATAQRAQRPNDVHARVLEAFGEPSPEPDDGSDGGTP